MPAFIYLSLASWRGAEGALPPPGVTELLGVAVTLAGLVAAAYHVGVWRQALVNLKHNVGAEVARHRQESAEHFARLDRRFEAVDRFIESATEQRVAIERSQARLDTAVAALEGTIARVVGAASPVVHRVAGDL